MINNGYVCECCGGKINPDTLICEYCGMKYKLDYYANNFLRRETFQAPVNKFACDVVMDQQSLYMLGPEKASEIAIHKIAAQMAEGLIPMIKYNVEYDPIYCHYKYRGEIRAIRPINGGKVEESI